MTLDEDKLNVYYPSVLRTTPDYIRDHVLIEFAMRNSIEPYEKRKIVPYLSVVESDATLPTPLVETLSPMRTFWEKATLMHVECHRGRLTESPDRLSRHWYDLYKLYNSPIGKDALQNSELLESIIVFKKAFFNASYANYDACLQGEFRLIPDAESLKSLEKDYKKMIRAGMFYKAAPSFHEIVTSLTELEKLINK